MSSLLVIETISVACNRAPKNKAPNHFQLLLDIFIERQEWNSPFCISPQYLP
ncbi:MAG: hypothetical protein VX148_07445 [Pseudomonadota bacterium]|nr:hypothetical protein [Pseudomonadota bacterium]